MLSGAVTLLLAAIILLEYALFWPFPTLDARQPDYFRELAQQDDVRAVLNVPVNDPLVSMQAMRQQMMHGKPMIAGQLYRRTPQDPAVLAVLDRAVRGEMGMLDDLFGRPDGTTQTMRDEDVPYLLSVSGVDRVIVHKYFLSDTTIVDRLTGILGAPEYEDDQIAAFVVPYTDDPGEYLRDELAFGYVEGMNRVGDRLYLDESGKWHFYAADESLVLLSSRLESFIESPLVKVRLDGHLVNAFAGDDRRWVDYLHVPPGYHTLSFESVTGCIPYPFTLTCLSEGECTPLDSPVCIGIALENVGQAPIDWLPMPLDVPFDHDVRLQAYLTRTAIGYSDLSVLLFWSADHALPANYALFVHLADPATGEPVAQYDGFPLIPTDEWEDDTRWVSNVSIPIYPRDFPPGEYAINVGWFDPVTNTRLPVLVEQSADQPWADADMIYLGTITINGENK
ncbi:MAG: hypothetical protein JXA10_17170 [Anaerolineae bacterium]|nr:hypothetical protein [Anaerolineae bacterium]